MTENVKDYYRQITEQNIGDVAHELLFGRITHETARLMQCDCPHHQSQSKKSLHIMLDKQGWYCFGCGVGGDILQLVEFVQSGTVTAGQSGPMPESHKQARDFLAHKIGLPPLSEFGLSPEELEKYEKMREIEERVKLALTELAKCYHQCLKENPEVLAWLKEHYSISDDSIDELQIGYADNAHSPRRILMESEHKFTPQELLATGAFLPTREGTLMPFFQKRLVFPYWSRGSVGFMIGRKTPWTENSQYEQMKYKKLPVHDADKHKYIAPCIDNSVLFNEDCLLSRPEKVIITEGVTDCLALMQAGFPAISPVTVRFRKEDWGRIIPKLRNIRTVYVCQDNEMSEAGLKGALQTVRNLAINKLNARIIGLPLAAKQLEARRLLKEKFKLQPGVDPRKLKELLQTRSEEEKAEVEKLLAEAKIDVNEYFVTGHDAGDFEELIETSATPMEFVINNLPDDLPDHERSRSLEAVFEEMAWEPPIEQGRLLRLVNDRFGKYLTMSEMRAQLHLSNKKRKSASRNNKKIKIIKSDNPRTPGKPAVELPYPPVKTDDVILPGRTDAELTIDLFTELGRLRAFYNYSGNIVQITELKRKDHKTGRELQLTGFDNVKPAGFVVDVEKYVDLGIYMTNEENEKVFVKSSLKRCSAENALSSVTARNLLPYIRGISEISLPYIRNGELKFTSPGFDENIGFWTDSNAPEIEFMPLEAARNVILETLSEFCFLEPELDIPRAIAYLFTPMLRAITGETRAMVFHASGNRPGVGKDCFLGLAPVIYTGNECAFCAPCNDDDEYRKLIFSICAAGERFFLVSNLKGHLASPAFEQASSLPFISGRTLGKSEQKTYPNLAVYGISSNGLTLSEDMERRIMDIRLEYYEEDVTERKFRHNDLNGYVKGRRPEILSALYSFVAHWHKSGAPDGENEIPSFSDWSRVISGILPACGFANPFAKRSNITASMHSGGNRDDENLKKLCIYWFRTYGCGYASGGMLRDLAEEQGLFQYFNFTERKHQVGFSKLLTSRANRHYAGLKLGADVMGKHNRYYLQVIDPDKYKSEDKLLRDA